MTKAIDLAKLITKELDKDWSSELEDYNLHFTLGAIYNLPFIEIEDKNRIICFIIYAYSPNSLWLDLQKDRLDNKKRILDNLGANIKEDIYQQILVGNSDIISMSVFNYLEELKDYRWPMVFNLLDYSSKMQRFSNENTESEKKWQEINKEGQKETLTEEVNVEVIVKINKQKGELLQLAIEKRKQAESILEEIRKDYLLTDEATKADFGFKMTDTASKKDILSWRTFIKDLNEKKKLATLQ